MNNLLSTVEEKMKEFDEKYKTVYDIYPDEKQGHHILLTDIKSHIISYHIALLEAVKSEIEDMKIIPVEIPHNSPYITGVNETVGNICDSLTSTITHLKENK